MAAVLETNSMTSMWKDPYAISEKLVFLSQETEDMMTHFMGSIWAGTGVVWGNTWKDSTYCTRSQRKPGSVEVRLLCPCDMYLGQLNRD
jgi:hypothetical protein